MNAADRTSEQKQYAETTRETTGRRVPRDTQPYHLCVTSPAPSDASQAVEGSTSADVRQDDHGPHARSRYVVHFGKRYLVVGETTLDGEPALVIAPRDKPAKNLTAFASQCREDRRHVVIRGYQGHRQGRPVVMRVRQENGETHIELRLKGTRASYTITLEGAYDLAARSAAVVAKRERVWQREQRRIAR